MTPDRPYAVRLSAVNAVGAGPFGDAELILDSAMLAQSPEMRSSYEDSVVGYTWLIALLGSLAFVLILISAVMLYYRKRHCCSRGSNSAQKNTYLSAHPVLTDRQFSSIKTYPSQQSPPAAAVGGQLWIDRRWNDLDEKDSNSSERKLLKGTTTTNSSAAEDCNNAGNNEYAYIDRRSLLNNSFHYEFKAPAASPEPYATTDIIRRQQQQQQQQQQQEAPPSYLAVSFSIDVIPSLKLEEEEENVLTADCFASYVPICL